MYVKKRPDWYYETRGHDLEDWTRAMQQARQTLIEWAARYDPGTYSELTDSVTALDWPDGAWTEHGGKIGHLLGCVSLDEWFEDRPLLSALCILKGDDQPSGGFYRLCEQLPDVTLPKGKQARHDFWLDEVKKCRDEWKK
jgi:hypothetical protein